MCLFASVCVHFCPLCLQIATLASEDQLALYRRLSFERGRCFSPVRRPIAALRPGEASAPEGLGGIGRVSRFTFSLKVPGEVLFASPLQPKWHIMRPVKKPLFTPGVTRQHLTPVLSVEHRGVQSSGCFPASPLLLLMSGSDPSDRLRLLCLQV